MILSVGHLGGQDLTDQGATIDVSQALDNLTQTSAESAALDYLRAQSVADSTIYQNQIADPTYLTRVAQQIGKAPAATPTTTTLALPTLPTAGQPLGQQIAYVAVPTSSAATPATAAACQQKLIKGVCDWYLLAAAAGLIALTVVGGMGGRR
jgi:hypothetical protein